MHYDTWTERPRATSAEPERRARRDESDEIAAVLALQHSAGNQAVTRSLGRATLARMPTLTAWLGDNKKKLDKSSFREYRMAQKFTKALDDARADSKRPAKNRESLKTLQGFMDTALTASKMDDLRDAVDGIAQLLTNPDQTIENLSRYATEIVREPERPAEGDGAPAVPPPPGSVRITAYQKAAGDFGKLLSARQADELMQAWGPKLTIGKLSPGRPSNEVLKVKEGVILNDSHIRLDGEHVDRTGRYQLFRVQGLKDNYPVLAGVFIQLGVAFSNEELVDAFATALRLAPAHQYGVVYSGEPYQPPQQS